MSDAKTNGPNDAARLEAALERIARARLSGPPPGNARPLAAEKLDTLIAELRAVLGRDSSD